MRSRPPLKRWGPAEIARSWGPRNPLGGVGDFPARSPALCACVSAQQPRVAWGVAGLAEHSKPAESPGLQPRAPHLEQCHPPRRDPGLARCRRGCVPLCVEYIPLSWSRCRVFLAQLPPGDSPPPAQRSPRAPCPLCQGEKATEPETKKLLPPSTLCPFTRPRHSPAPSLDPGDTARAYAKGRDQGDRGQGGRVRFPHAARL